MIKLSDPQYTFEQTIDNCIAGIVTTSNLRVKLGLSKHKLVAFESRYLEVGSAGELYTIPPLNTANDPDPTVVDSLNKSELIKLYDKYFVPEKKPARKIYDALLNSAKEKCPFCGGIGTPRNLDHFLPKAKFPQFSVLPRNLVPACRDCNMDGKGTNVATRAEDQIIHPYIDKEIFFSEQWIFAKYHTNRGDEPGEFEYFTSPPGGWTAVDQQRARKHFENFNLAKRYATKAAELLGTVLRQIHLLKGKGIENQIIGNVLIEPGIECAQFANHWRKAMYQALKTILV